jgi:hypothetical protein
MDSSSHSSLCDWIFCQIWKVKSSPSYRFGISLTIFQPLIHEETLPLSRNQSFQSSEWQDLIELNRKQEDELPCLIAQFSDLCEFYCFDFSAFGIPEAVRVLHENAV